MKKKKSSKKKSFTSRQVKNSRNKKYKKYHHGVKGVFGPLLPPGIGQVIKRPAKVIDSFGKAVFGPGF